MYDGHIINERQDGAADILRALAVREICQASPYATEAEAIEEHMGRVAYDGGVAVWKERALLKKGKELFDQGYRIRHGKRRVFGAIHNVPPEALAWVLVTAGYIATSEAYRLDYLVRVKER